jgi:hypothetical protein
MDRKTKGAWIVHHKVKLDEISGVESDFMNIVLAGKCSTLLSSISQSRQTTLTMDRVRVLTQAAGINYKTELPAILNELERQKLIEQSSTGIEVLGLTSASILEHTTTIFEENEPLPQENAVIELSDKASERPFKRKGGSGNSTNLQN